MAFPVSPHLRSVGNSSGAIRGYGGLQYEMGRRGGDPRSVIRTSGAAPCQPVAARSSACPFPAFAQPELRVATSTHRAPRVAAPAFHLILATTVSQPINEQRRGRMLLSLLRLDARTAKTMGTTLTPTKFDACMLCLFCSLCDAEWDNRCIEREARVVPLLHADSTTLVPYILTHHHQLIRIVPPFQNLLKRVWARLLGTLVDAFNHRDLHYA